MLEIHDTLVSSSNPMEILRDLFKNHFEATSHIIPSDIIPFWSSHYGSVPFWSSHHGLRIQRCLCGSVNSILGLCCGLRIQCCCSCGVHCSCGLDSLPGLRTSKWEKNELPKMKKSYFIVNLKLLSQRLVNIIFNTCVQFCFSFEYHPDSCEADWENRV